jgi:hypothetical protein
MKEIRMMMMMMMIMMWWFETDVSGQPIGFTNHLTACKRKTIKPAYVPTDKYGSYTQHAHSEWLFGVDD